ncbi:MAG: sensor domain-containing diguanylate cyclase [Thermodesulfobacteriota bacterium]
MYLKNIISGGYLKSIGAVIGILWSLCSMTTLPATVSAEECISISAGRNVYPIAGKSIDLLEDRHLEYTIRQITTPEINRLFQPNRQDCPNLGFTRSVHWLRFSIFNRSSNRIPLFLEIAYPLLDEVTLYCLIPGMETTARTMGQRFPFPQRHMKHRNFVFPLQALPFRHQTYYLQVASQDSVTLPMTIYSINGFLRKEQRSQYVLGLFYGIMIVMIAYNLFIYLSVRDRSYLYYVLFISAFFFYIISENGIAFQYLWPRSPWWSKRAIPFFVSITIVWSSLFVRNFLQTRKNTPRIHRMISGFIAAGLAGAVLSLSVEYYVAVIYNVLMVFVYAPTLIVCGYVCRRKGFRPGAYFLAAWSVLLVGSIVYALKVFSFLPEVFLTRYGVVIGAVSMVVLLSLGLADRINAMRRELQSLNASLEQKVYERTQALHNALNRLSEANQKLEALSTVDGLTNVKNRRFFDDRILQEGKRSHREKLPLSVLMVDIDHFKKVNDRHGHQMGDECLKAVAAAIEKSTKRPADTVARYGGEEFGVILPATDSLDAAHVAERIRSAIESTPITINGHTFPMTVSVGVSTRIPGSVEEAEELLAEADRALYQAKAAGRNQVVVFSENA